MLETKTLEMTTDQFEGLLNSQEVVRTSITPDLANEMLSKNTTNRTLKIHRVRELVKTLQNGHWTYNAQPITFDVEGKLQNGQHRLQACLDSGIALDTLVAFGLDTKAVWGVDQGAIRSLSDHLKMRGEQYYGVLASTISLLNAKDKKLTNFGKNFKRVITPFTAEDLLDKYPQIRSAVAYVYAYRAPLPVTSLAYLLFEFKERDPGLAYNWLAGFVGERMVSPEEPLYEYMQFCTKAKAKEVVTDRFDLLSRGMASFDAMRAAA